MFTVEVRTGRLLEARIRSLASRDEADGYAREIAARVAKLPPDVRPVLCADHRPVVVYTQPVADRLSELFQQMNDRLERVAILVNESNATLALQLRRIVREAGWSSRRVLTDGTEATTFLGEVLDAQERARLATFVGGK